MADRTYDLVLFGATGFTGSLTAEYLARHAPERMRWALAGRDRDKLESVRNRLAELDPAYSDLGLITADVTDPTSMRRMAEQARVVISTVGPFLEYGDPVVKACAEAGTDYVDLTGEPEFVDRVYLDHHATACGTGARIVHACGFDSVPHDLGVYFTVQQLPEGVPIHVDGYVRSGGSFSGGTFHSAVNAMSRGRRMLSVTRQRRAREPRPARRRVSGRAGRPHRCDDPRGWALPLPTIDPQVVARSGRALDRYGPDFSYRHHALVKKLPVAVGVVAAAGAVLALAQLSPTRRMLLSRISPGEGPGPRRRARSWFTVRFVGTAGGQRVVTEVAGGDPGYDETAKMLAESALCLAFDDNPATCGQTTTAAAMGDNLLRRLVDAGIRMRVL
ncbi:MAG TPA: saccharopine dehydrogenase NADP-binding domain-containing protein [Nocardioidaceae bacterium]|nr:saccharopine dehydrogenase NADP-binding domain-containing protein [Nocardioidaceae bacterium]